MLKYILIFGAIIAAFALLMPQQFGETTTSIKSLFIPQSQTQSIAYNPNYTHYPITSNSSIQQYTPVNNSINLEVPQNTTITLPPPQVDPCLLTHLGFPNYAGTNKQGQTCKDTISNPDYECIANPPINYEGYVDKINKDSSPKMWCCTMDGSCRW